MGFSFITPDDGSEDRFVHRSLIKAEGYRSLVEDEAVEFTIAEDDDGRTKAVEVIRLDGSSVQGADGRRDGFGGRSSRGYGGGGTVKWFNGTKGFGFFTPTEMELSSSAAFAEVRAEEVVAAVRGEGSLAMGRDHP
ncbi:hypothetical protein COCNU_01G022230 [Cocos nucifera]|uniref:CSD domain-containing protein n=1 Tax=Cocos nucifera TaxID=13894 RepID=A0A8K0HXC0_COCNU|nr:hypothetical protein COCNU_01G022230 [Cocos nucifera]